MEWPGNRVKPAALPARGPGRRARLCRFPDLATLALFAAPTARPARRSQGGSEMSMLFKHTSPVQVVYPESDGEPMSDNTKQLRWIVTLYGNLAALFRDNPDVFVGGNQFWYPVEGEPGLKQAPDVYVVF